MTGKFNSNDFVLMQEFADSLVRENDKLRADNEGLRRRIGQLEHALTISSRAHRELLMESEQLVREGEELKRQVDELQRLIDSGGELP